MARRALASGRVALVETLNKEAVFSVADDFVIAANDFVIVARDFVMAAKDSVIAASDTVTATSATIIATNNSVARNTPQCSEVDRLMSMRSMRSALAVCAKDRGAPINGSRVDEPPTALATWLPTATVHGELLDKRSTLPARVAIVAKTGTSSRN